MSISAVIEPHPSRASAASAGKAPDPGSGLALGFGVLYVVLALIYMFFGRFVGDEGWEALAARNVLEGKMLYRDFHFSQMPLVPYLYAGWFALFGPGIEAGRALSLLCGLAGLVCGVKACYARAGALGAFLCGALLTLNLNYLADTVVFRTQPLSVALTGLGIFVLSKPVPGRQLVQLGLAMLCMSLAFLGRLSLLPAIVLLWPYALWVGRGRWPWVAALVAVNASLLTGVFLFFYADGNLIFSIYRTHQEFFGFPPWTFERLFGHFLSGWAANQLLLIFGLLWAIAWLAREAWLLGLKRVLENEDLLLWFYLLAAYAGVTLIHVINVQSHPTHQTSIVIFAAVLGAVAMARGLQGSEPRIRRLVAASFVMLGLLSAPAQEWALDFSGKGSMGSLAEASRVIRHYARPDSSILTLSAELPVNSGLRILPGYDMSEFTYFPKMDDARTAKLKVTNRAKLRADLTGGKADILCLGDREYSMLARGDDEEAKELRKIIAEHFTHVAQIEGYGQFLGNMIVFVAKEQKGP